MEKMIFEDYEEWVDDQTILTNQEITTAKTLIDKLTAEIDKATSDITNLNADIDELDGEIAAWEKDQKAATELRSSENAEYMKVQADYSESIDAIARAIMVLGQQNVDYKQAAALLEETSAVVPHARQVLQALIQEESSQQKASSDGAPAVAAYEFQSGGIIEMLKKLKKKFKFELNDAETAEANAAHNFEMEMLHLGDSIENAKGDRNKKSETKAMLMTQVAENKSLLADTKTSLAEDEAYLADLLATFKAKTEQYEMNQQVRADEITALQKAVEIMSSGAVAGNAEKHLPGLVQKAVTHPVSLLQMSRTSHRSSLRERAAALLGERAKAL